jgi:hypothetical protein
LTFPVDVIRYRKEIKGGIVVEERIWKTDKESCPYIGKFPPIVVVSQCRTCLRNGMCGLKFKEMSEEYEKQNKV